MPAEPRAGVDVDVLQSDRQQAGGDLFAGRKYGVVFAGVEYRPVLRGSRHHSTSRSVVPAIADTTTATSWPASTSRLTWRATLRIRSISATEVPPNFITRRAITRAFPERRVLIPVPWTRCNKASIGRICGPDLSADIVNRSDDRDGLCFARGSAAQFPANPSRSPSNSTRTRSTTTTAYEPPLRIEPMI